MTHHELQSPAENPFGVLKIRVWSIGSIRLSSSRGRNHRKLLSHRAHCLAGACQLFFVRSVSYQAFALLVSAAFRLFLLSGARRANSMGTGYIHTAMGRSPKGDENNHRQHTILRPHQK